MFSIFFGWRKASKCKKLIRKLQSRLKLLKNKRSCIVRQLRDDIAVLLKCGHQQTAFDRAEQLFKDECELKVYQLLDNFCEFIIINYSYIRKFKNCPNDIKEAVSTLIFSSSRFGELPELKKIRELFKNRYGRRFATIALDLLPGNLVNQQIMDLRRQCIQSVSLDVKFRLVSEIDGNCRKSRPMLIDFLKAEKCSEDETQSGDIIITDTKPRIVRKNSSTESKNFNKDSLVPSSKLSQLSNYAASSVGKKMDEVDHWNHNLPSFESTKPARNEGNGVAYNGFSLIQESSSECSNSSPEEMVYLDDIEEFVSSVRIEGNLQDQRVFIFSPSNCRSRYMNGESRRRQRKRSISLEKRCIIDSESAIYYDASSDTSNNRKHLKKGSKCEKIGKCSDEHPCYLCKSGNVDFLIYQSVESLSKKEREEFIQDGLCCTCMKALSMPPPERWFKKDDDFMGSNSTPKSSSSPVQKHGLLSTSSDHHVHPKLPDYDDLAAKFISLKKVYLECSQ